jgi:signal transduction histidine kinase
MQAPPVHLEKIIADDQVVASYHSGLPAADTFDLQTRATGLALAPGRQRVEFDFTAVSFDAARNARFQYRLDGVDDRWLDAGAQRSAVYSKLSAGDYQFHVRACNGDGVWNEEGAGIAFSLKPQFWQTWWFQIPVALLFTGLVVIFARYVSFRRLQRRVRLLEQQSALHKERARIARDLHDDLGARLTKIVMLSDMSRRENGGGLSEQAQQISSAARQSIKSLDETVWAVNPRNDTLSHLIDYVGQFAVEFLSSAGIRCRVDLLENSPDRPVSAEARHHVLLVVKEVLNNVVRHAGATEVWLRVSLDADFICLSIEDNGRGFVVPRSGNGDPNADGLRNIAHRMNEIGGRSEIESAPGAGTRISLIFPWSAKEITTL